MCVLCALSVHSVCTECGVANKGLALCLRKQLAHSLHMARSTVPRVSLSLSDGFSILHSQSVQLSAGSRELSSFHLDSDRAFSFPGSLPLG